MWPKAKRAVSDAAAAAIAAAARAGGAQAVGVFVDEDAATIARRCRQAGISIAQLHGDASRAALADIPPDLQVCCVWAHTPPRTPQHRRRPAADAVRGALLCARIAGRVRAAGG
jgi:phosphoribosylanthranilate isomerase